MPGQGRAALSGRPADAYAGVAQLERCQCSAGGLASRFCLPPHGLVADEIPHQICGRTAIAHSGYDRFADLLSA